MNRRTMLGMVAGGSLACLVPGARVVAQSERTLPYATPSRLPRWRGFNLLEMFMVDQVKRFREDDFAWIAELGFNFVRLPLDYRCWIKDRDWRAIREDRLEWVDEAVELGRQHRIHVQVNFHRAPGFTVASPPEAKSVWTDSEAQDVCAEHWGRFAKRYQGRPSRELSFNLFNEPANVGPEPHRKAVERMVAAIREHDKERLIVCDGRDYATKAPTELIGLGVAAATRGYAPFHLTHYKASWVQGSDKWAKPTYPMIEGGSTWDRARLERDQMRPWEALEAKGVGVMVGEFGAYNRTPHEVVLPWMRDCLEAWKSANWGWALWNFRGGFGILDSERTDVAYKDWRGHKLDQAMLELLQAS